MTSREGGCGSSSTGGALGQGGHRTSPWELSLPLSHPAWPALTALPQGLSFPTSTMAPHCADLKAPSAVIRPLSPLPLPAWGVKTPALTSWGGQASSRGLTSPSPTRGWRQSPRCLSLPGQLCGYSVRPPISAFLGPDVRPAPGSPFGQRQQRWGRGGGVAGAWRLIFLYSPSPGPPERAWVQGPRGRSLGAAASTAPRGIGGN